MTVCCFLATSLPSFAQQSDQSASAKLPAPIKQKILKAQEARAKFVSLLKRDRGMIALHDGLKSKGFQAQNGDKNFWGKEETFEQGETTLISKLYVQDYAKPNSKEAAGLIQISVSDGVRSDVYSFTLIAPDGKWENAEEYSADETSLDVNKMNSWWTCVKKRLAGVGAACASSLIACSGTAAAYIACVAIGCGGAALAASACCECNCKWYCKYVIGCCKK